MKIVSVREAKARFSDLVAQVARGEEVLITRAGKPIARLIPTAPVPGGRVLGMDRGRAAIADDFDAPL